MMNFWNKLFSRKIYHLEYEKVINNPNNEIKNLIKFCELEWEDSCLDFYNTKRSIKTLSVSEARKPIYKSSLSGSSNFQSYFKNSFEKLEKF